MPVVTRSSGPAPGRPGPAPVQVLRRLVLGCVAPAACLALAACTSTPAGAPVPAAPPVTAPPVTATAEAPAGGQPDVVTSGQASGTEGTSTVVPGPSCRTPRAVREPLPAEYPEGLALPPGAVLTGVEHADGYALVTGRVAADVGSVLEHFGAAVEAAGLVVQRQESEGRSGQLVFFGALREGGVSVARLACPAGETGFTVRSRAPGR